MTHQPSSRHAAIEPLESRIAPASVIASAHWETATFGAPIALHAGDGLSTAGANAGTYLLYVEKGDALVFLTDLNNNGNVDFNEVTGIAAGDGLRLTSFVDIHGDIATNLVKTAASLELAVKSIGASCPNGYTQSASSSCTGTDWAPSVFPPRPVCPARTLAGVAVRRWGRCAGVGMR